MAESNTNMVPRVNDEVFRRMADEMSRRLEQDLNQFFMNSTVPSTYADPGAYDRAPSPIANTSTSSGEVSLDQCISALEELNMVESIERDKVLRAMGRRLEDLSKQEAQQKEEPEPQWWCKHCKQVTSTIGKSHESRRNAAIDSGNPYRMCGICLHAAIPYTAEALAREMGAAMHLAEQGARHEAENVRLNRRIRELSQTRYWCPQLGREVSEEETIPVTIADSKYGMIHRVRATGMEAVFPITREQVWQLLARIDAMDQQPRETAGRGVVQQLQARIAELTKQLESLGQQPPPPRSGRTARAIDV